MKKSKFLNYTLFTAIFLAFPLTLPSIIVEANNNHNTSLATQVATSPQLLGDQSMVINGPDSGFTVTVHTDALLTLTPETIPVSLVKIFINDGNEFFSYSNSTGNNSKGKELATVKQVDKSGRVQVQFFSTDLYTGSYSNNKQYWFTTSVDSSEPLYKSNTTSLQILPSNVTISNYKKYVNLIDPQGSFISVTGFNWKDDNGTLQIIGTCYDTTYHGKDAVVGDFQTDWISGFASNTALPVITFNSTNIQHTTENEFASKFILNDPLATINNTANLMTISNIGVNLIKDISYASEKVTLTYYSTSWSGSPVSFATEIVRGFATPTPTPKISVDQSKITQIFESDFSSKIIDSDPITTLSNLTGYVTISGIEAKKITNITYSNGSFKVFYPISEWSGSSIISVGKSISGFKTKSIKPTFTVKSAASQILPSDVSTSNYLDYLNVVDSSNALIDSDIHFDDDNVNGTLTVSGTYYSTSIHNAAAKTSNYSYILKGFFSSDIKPSFSSTSSVYQILPSEINNANYSKYIVVDNSSASLILKDIKYKASKDEGTLLISGTYYTTSAHYDKSPKANYSYNLEGFAQSAKAPTFTLNSEGKKKLPSEIKPEEYTTYFDVTDEDNSLIPNSVRFVSANDNKGELTITAKYYTTTYHGANAPTSVYNPGPINGFVFNGNEHSVYFYLIIVLFVFIILLLIALIVWTILKKRKKKTRLIRTNHVTKSGSILTHSPQVNNDITPKRNSRANQMTSNQNLANRSNQNKSPRTGINENKLSRNVRDKKTTNIRKNPRVTSNQNGSRNANNLSSRNTTLNRSVRTNRINKKTAGNTVTNNQQISRQNASSQANRNKMVEEILEKFTQTPDTKKSS